MTQTRILLSLLLIAGSAAFAGCGDDEPEVDRLGIGAQCAVNDDCNVDEDQVCLTTFKGGYCSTPGGCATSDDCPDLSACVTAEDGMNYCFRTCVDKSECNRNRSVDNESNCSSSITFASGDKEGVKACVPPSN